MIIPFLVADSHYDQDKYKIYKNEVGRHDEESKNLNYGFHKVKYN